MLDVPGLEYFKGKNTWCGSSKNIRFRIAAADDALTVAVWPEPFAFDKTPEKQKVYKSFEYNDGGLTEIKAYLEEQIEKQVKDSRG